LTPALTLTYKAPFKRQCDPLIGVKVLFGRGIFQEVKQMKIRPMNDRVLVLRVEEEQKTAGGIIIPDTAKEKPQEGKVVSVGSGQSQ
jgi:hypothetical protein